MDIIFIRGRKFGKDVKFSDLLRVYNDLTINEFIKSGGTNGVESTDNFEKLETETKPIIKKSDRKNRRSNT